MLFLYNRNALYNRILKKNQMYLKINIICVSCDGRPSEGDVTRRPSLYV